MQLRVAFKNKQSIFSRFASRKCIVCFRNLKYNYVWYNVRVCLCKNYIIDLTCRQQAFFFVFLIQQIEFSIVQLSDLSSESFAADTRSYFPSPYQIVASVHICILLYVTSHLSLFYPLSFVSVFGKAMQVLHVAGQFSGTMEQPDARINKWTSFSNCPRNIIPNPSFVLLPDVAFHPSDTFCVYQTTIKVSRHKKNVFFPNPQSQV